MEYIYDQSSETIYHLLLSCPFSRAVWFQVLRRLGYERLLQQAQSDYILDWWAHARKLIPKVWRRGFDSLVVLICWLLWKERNDRTFNRRSHTVDDVVRRVFDEIITWSQAGFRQLELFASLGVPGRENLAL